MSARQASAFSEPRPSNRPTPPGKIPAAGPGGRKSGAHAEDGGFQPMTDLRLSIADLRSPSVAAHQHAGQGPNRRGGP
jgi:hypothetical protein